MASALKPPKRDQRSKSWVLTRKAGTQTRSADILPKLEAHIQQGTKRGFVWPRGSSIRSSPLLGRHRELFVGAFEGFTCIAKNTRVGW